MALQRLAKSSILAGLFLSLSTPFSCRRNDILFPAGTCGAEPPALKASAPACEADADCSSDTEANRTDPAPNTAFACLDPSVAP